MERKYHRSEERLPGPQHYFGRCILGPHSQINRRRPFLHVSACVLVLAFGVSDALAKGQGLLDAGLASVRVVSMDAGHSIVYVPIRFAIHDTQGRTVPSLTCTKVGEDSVILSGELAPEADPADIETIRSRAKALGGGAQEARILRPRRREASLAVGSQEFSLGDVPSDALGPIVLQQMIPKQLLSRSSPKIAVRLFWSEVLPSADVQYRVDWSLVHKELVYRAGTQRVVSVDVLASLADYAFRSRWIVITGNGTTANSPTPAVAALLPDLIVNLIERALLTPAYSNVATAFNESGQTYFYSLKERVDVSQLGRSFTFPSGSPATWKSFGCSPCCHAINR